MHTSAVLILASVVLAACIPLHAQGGDRPAGRTFATRSEVIARNGAAATSHPLATQIAIDMQPQGQVQVLCNLIDFGMSVQEAADAARFRHGGSSEPSGRRMTDGGEVRLESGIGVDVRNALSAMGHNVAPIGGPYGGCQAILYDEKNDVYIGASESRKDGQAAGY
jgi:gamma-glutamyltranspeptidase